MTEHLVHGRSLSYSDNAGAPSLINHQLTVVCH